MAPNEMKLDRRSLLRLLGAGTAGLVLAACGSSEPAAAPPVSVAPSAAARASSAAPVSSAVAVTSPAPSAKPAGSPKIGGTLKQGYFLDIVSLDPQYKVGNDATWIGVYDRITSY